MGVVRKAGDEDPVVVLPHPEKGKVPRISIPVAQLQLQGRLRQGRAGRAADLQRGGGVRALQIFSPGLPEGKLHGTVVPAQGFPPMVRRHHRQRGEHQLADGVGILRDHIQVRRGVVRQKGRDADLGQMDVQPDLGPLSAGGQAEQILRPELLRHGQVPSVSRMRELHAAVPQAEPLHGDLLPGGTHGEIVRGTVENGRFRRSRIARFSRPAAVRPFPGAVFSGNGRLGGLPDRGIRRPAAGKNLRHKDGGKKQGGQTALFHRMLPPRGSLFRKNRNGPWAGYLSGLSQRAVSAGGLSRRPPPPSRLPDRNSCGNTPYRIPDRCSVPRTRSPPPQPSERSPGCTRRDRRPSSAWPSR